MTVRVLKAFDRLAGVKFQLIQMLSRFFERFQRKLDVNISLAVAMRPGDPTAAHLNHFQFVAPFVILATS